MVRAELAGIVDSLAGMLADTRLEDDLADLLWSFASIFHRKIDRLERDLDTNEQAQIRSRRDQNGSEIASVELERLIEQGIGLIERRNAFEFFRDTAAERYEAVTGSTWRPRVGSMVNHRTLTAAMIDSRDFLAARQRAESHFCCRPVRALPLPEALSATTIPVSGMSRPRSCQASRYGAAAWRKPERRRTHRRLLGRQSQGRASGLQARLDPPQERSALQA